MSDDKPQQQWTALETRLDYTFKDHALLAQALIAPSYRANHPELADNQRLEFLGDAVFDLLAADYFYERHPDEHEGMLTARRARLASGPALAKLARKISLGDFLQIGISDEITGGRTKDRVLAEAMESVFGAAWLDGGIGAVQRLFKVLVRDVQDAGEDYFVGNPKGLLQKIAQAHAWPDSPVYTVVSVTGPAHEPAYTVRASVSTGDSAEATARSKRHAEADAAAALIKILNEKNLLTDTVTKGQATSNEHATDITH